MTTNKREDVIIDRCDGHKGNKRCKDAHRAGRSVHIIPRWDATTESVVLPTYHYKTRDEAVKALADARKSARTVTCDNDLYYFRACDMPYKLPVGWIDPARRHPDFVPDDNE